MATLEESLLEIPPLEPEEIETIETVEAEDYLYNEENDSGEGKLFPLYVTTNWIRLFHGTRGKTATSSRFKDFDAFPTDKQCTRYNRHFHRD